MAQVPTLNGQVSPASATSAQFTAANTPAKSLIADIAEKGADKLFNLAVSIQKEDARLNRVKELQDERERKAAEKLAKAQAEDAMLQDIKNRYNVRSAEALYGKGGFFTRTGAAVVKPNDKGLTFVEQLNGELDTIVSSVMSDAPPEVALKARTMLSGMVASDVGNGHRYYGAQSDAYIKSLTAIGLNNAVSAYTENPTPENRSMVFAASAKVASVSGLDLSNPAVQADVANGAKARISAGVQSNVQLRLDSGDIDGAEALFMSATQSGDLTASAAYGLQKTLSAYRRDETINDTAGNASTALVLSRTPSVVGGEIIMEYGGDIASLSNAVGLSPSDVGSPSGVRGRVNAGRIMDYLTDKFGSVEAALAAGVVGEKAVESAISRGGANGWRDALSANEKAKVTKALNTFYARTSETSTPSTEQIISEVRAANPGLDEAGVREAAGKAKARFEFERARSAADQYSAAKQVLDTLASGGALSDVPFSVRSRLSENQRAAATALDNRPVDRPFEGNSTLFTQLSRSPDKLKNLSDADFELVIRSQLTDTQYAYLAARRDNLKGMKSVSYGVDVKDVERAVDDFGRSKYGESWVKRDEAMNFRRAELISNVFKEANERASQNVGVSGKTGTLSSDELTSIARGFDGRKLRVPGGMFSSSSRVSVADLSVGDFTSANRVLGEELAKSTFAVDDPTDEQVKEALVHWAYSPDTEVDPVVARFMQVKYGKELAAISSAVEAASGRTPGPAALLNLFILAQQGDPAYTNTFGAPDATTAKKVNYGMGDSMDY